MHTFEVDNVKLSRRKFSAKAPEKAWDHLLTHHREKPRSYEMVVEPTGAVLLACSQKSLLENTGPNALASAVGMAYNHHYPLSLSPTVIWTAIAQGLGLWICENAEAVRSQFVSHTGKVKLEVLVNPNPDWPQVLSAFSEMIASHIGKKRDLFVSDFSTTTLDERMASEVVLMHSMSKYFSYGMQTMCGFPRITLEGSVEDWEKIYDRVRLFGEFGAFAKDAHMKEWVDALLPTLGAFVESAKGNPDKSFWKGLYQVDGGSGGPYISGHILNFFPYSNSHGKLYPNRYFTTKSKGGFHNGFTPGQFDRGMSKVDVDWDNGLRSVEFHAGLVGVSMAEDFTLRPECGWAILDVTKKTAK